MTGAAVRPVLLFDLALKAALVGLLVLAVSRPHLPQLEGDGYAIWRALTYPISLFVVPVGWALFGRARAERFPYELDLLVPVPLLVDVAAPRLYHSVEWWDKLMHVVSWGVLGAVCVLMLSWFRLRRVVVAGVAVAIGLFIAGLWESFEYFVWVRPSPDLLETEVADTFGDLVCDLAALLLAVVLTLLLTTRGERVRREPGTSPDGGEASPMGLVGWP